MSVSTTEIGRRVGVSQATVSDVLNGRWQQKRISPVTSERVLAMARQLNYRPNRVARSLLTGRSHTLALMMPTFSGSYFAQIATGVEAEAKKHGYHVLLSHVVTGLEDEVREIEILLERRVDGLIVAPRYGAQNRAKYRELLQENVPLVFVNDHFDDVPCSAVVGDDFTGAYRATEHLIGLGHARIAHLAGNCGPTVMQMRMEGYRAAMRDHGLTVPEEYVQGFVERTVDTAPEGMRCLLALPNRPTAVTTSSDFSALAAIEVIWAAGLQVPQDVAVVGCNDDLEEVRRFLKIPLTTVRVDAKEMGRRAMALLIEEMRTPGRKKILEKLPAELVIRESCGAKRS